MNCDECHDALGVMDTLLGPVKLSSYRLAGPFIYKVFCSGSCLKNWVAREIE